VRGICNVESLNRQINYEKSPVRVQVNVMKKELSTLIPPDQIFRPVEIDGLDHTLLCDSISKNGLLVPITVCQDKIVDGYRRYLACKGLGFTEVDVHIVEGDPDALRIIAQTRATPFTREEKRAYLGAYLASNRQATAGEVAHAHQWSLDEVEGIAGIQYLAQPWLQAYKSGSVPLSTVWQLARIREDAQLSLWESEGDPFEQAQAIHRTERNDRRRSMVARPRCKGYTQISKELETPREAGLELIKANAETPMDGWIACLKWILHSD